MLAQVQRDLPDSLTPYADLAALAGRSEEEVIALLAGLREEGVIRRFGASIKHQRAGWAFNAMVAWRVRGGDGAPCPDERVEELGRRAAAHPNVSHCYYRPSSAPDWPYELYTMAHGRSEAECAAVVEELGASLGLEDRGVLKSLRELKKISPTYFQEGGPEDGPSGESMTSTSEALFARACELIPGGVNSPVRACHNVHASPLFIARGRGSRIFDVDGNEYVDFVLSWGPMILGHAHEEVTRAVAEAAARGTSYGAPCEDEVNLARMVVGALPSVEMVRMVNSGTEATMSALRLARGYTGRARLVKVGGCDHGHADPFLAAAGSGLATFSIPGTPGVPEAVVADTLLAPYNDLAAVEALFEERGSEIAAVIVEPVAANMGLVPPRPGFLEGLREITRRHGALLIFDEVITGFRLGYSGAQGRFGVDPDLTTLGKIIGGGLPVGAFGGRAEIMRNVAPAGKVYQAGTLSGNPLAMAAGLATLSRLKSLDYGALERRTAAFASELEAILRAKGLPIQVHSVASMFTPYFTEGPVDSFEDVQRCDQALFERFYKGMRSRGVYLAPSAFETGMVSFVHTEEDFSRALDAARALVF